MLTRFDRIHGYMHDCVGRA